MTRWVVWLLCWWYDGACFNVDIVWVEPLILSTKVYCGRCLLLKMERPRFMVCPFFPFFLANVFIEQRIPKSRLPLVSKDRFVWTKCDILMQILIFIRCEGHKALSLSLTHHPPQPPPTTQYFTYVMWSVFILCREHLLFTIIVIPSWSVKGLQLYLNYIKNNRSWGPQKHETIYWVLWYYKKLFSLKNVLELF